MEAECARLQASLGAVSDHTDQLIAELEERGRAILHLEAAAHGLRGEVQVEKEIRSKLEAETEVRKMFEAETDARKMLEAETEARKMLEAETEARKMLEAETEARKKLEAIVKSMRSEVEILKGRDESSVVEKELAEERHVRLLGKGHRQNIQ